MACARPRMSPCPSLVAAQGLAHPFWTDSRERIAGELIKLDFRL